MDAPTTQANPADLPIEDPKVSENEKKKTMPAIEAAETVKDQVQIWATPIPLPLKDGRDPAEMKTELEFSPGLAEWLGSKGVSLAFTTYDSGHLFLAGVLPDGKLGVMPRHFPRAMGLATHNDRLFVASKDYLWRLENVAPPAQRVNKLFDRAYVPRSAQTTGGLDVHEMAIMKNGQLIFVNTRFSCLATVHQKHSFTPVWKPSFITELKGEDRCHLNGLAMVDGVPRFVTAFYRTNEKRGWREKPVDQGILIDVKAQRTVAEGFVKPHSPRVYNDTIYVLDSGRGYLVRVDPTTGSRENVAFMPGFLRGLSFLGNYAVINSSMPRDKTFEGLPLEENIKQRGGEPQCGIYIVDLTTGETVHWLRLKGRIREMFDVMFLEGIHCPMQIGLGTPEFSSTVTIGRPTRRPGRPQAPAAASKGFQYLPGRPLPANGNGTNRKSN